MLRTLKSRLLFTAFIVTTPGTPYPFSQNNEDVSQQGCLKPIFCYRVPEIDEVLKEIHGRDTQEQLPAHRLILTTWNIYKGDKDGWDRDLKLLSFQSDLLLLQEAVYDREIRKKFKNGFEEFSWNFATSFVNESNSQATGVMTGSRAPSIHTTFVRSPDREPVTETPKMSIFTRYLLPNGKTLLVVNIHAINFNPEIHTAIERQMKLVELVIQRHEGPAILAGDFNTWNLVRANIVEQIAQRNGFYQVRVPNDTRKLVLDRVFLRELLAGEVRLRTDITSSDHAPLTVEARY